MTISEITDESNFSSDDGPGLPNEEMKKVFARGFRLDEQTPGSGLGLNIVKDIIEIYKGKIWLEKSNDLGGLEVNIKLPISFLVILTKSFSMKLSNSKLFYCF